MAQQMARNWQSLLFGALLFMGMVTYLELTRPQIAHAAQNDLTNASLGAEVATSTTSTRVTVPGGRGLAFYFHVPSSEATGVYIYFGGSTRGATPTASASNYDIKLDPGQTISVNQHDVPLFAYAAVSGTPTLEYLVTYRR